MQKATIQLETLTCPSCMQKIENGVKSLDGVSKESLKVLFNSSKVSIKDIEHVIDKLGYEVLKSQVKNI